MKKKTLLQMHFLYSFHSKLEMGLLSGGGGGGFNGGEVLFAQ